MDLPLSSSSQRGAAERLVNTIWSGVGMGERLGRVETLAAGNVGPISPEEGCAWLERLLEAPDLPARVVVSGRVGDAKTLRAQLHKIT